jgi:hypothetical protein
MAEGQVLGVKALLGHSGETRPPKPGTRNPTPGTRNRIPGTRNPSPRTLAGLKAHIGHAGKTRPPKPETRKPEHETFVSEGREIPPGTFRTHRQLKPETWNSEPDTRNTKPNPGPPNGKAKREARNPKPETRNPTAGGGAKDGLGLLEGDSGKYHVPLAYDPSPLTVYLGLTRLRKTRYTLRFVQGLGLFFYPACPPTTHQAELEIKSGDAGVFELCLT